ncbi:COP9 signalosome complex subunit 8-like isoform X1 [Argiope bruennichi]|uniref:COP9 signalosome complex subunit 8 n=1 Tax=Argiope bruennichi TaxID=94029 RepID=A0A8T0EN70_ARGBR|nr:COP9 signalosome complex subunit 8-like isoform X1 [Argiope bruennichi]XP_055951276.1 COP9 signalosome complex subunit 8-like isoform X1 [Argiope bruennichi]KAF8774116.1 COP9 signalosome complex subunit 8 like protein [Argiope bruennichi]
MTIEKARLLCSGDPSIQQYCDMAEDLEKQELEAPDGIATPQVYGQLLAIYLLQNDLPNAKFLWKRIRENIKEENPELGKLWTVGQKLWQCDSDVYVALAEEWPEHLKPIVSAIKDVTRNRALRLISKAYSSITVEKISAFLGLPSEDCIEALTALGWEIDAACKIMKPKSTDNKPEDCFQSEEQLAKLTDFVAFLEN